MVLPVNQNVISPWGGTPTEVILYKQSLNGMTPSHVISAVMSLLTLSFQT